MPLPRFGNDNDSHSRQEGGFGTVKNCDSFRNFWTFYGKQSIVKNCDSFRNFRTFYGSRTSVTNCDNPGILSSLMVWAPIVAHCDERT